MVEEIKDRKSDDVVLVASVEINGKQIEIYDYDDDDGLKCFSCQTNIDEYDDEAYLHPRYDKWFCLNCFTFVMDNE